MKLITKTIGQLLEEKARITPNKDFIIYSDRNLKLSYSDFNTKVDELAKGLLAIGIKKGMHVGIWATNVPDWSTFMFATAKIGAVLVTINTEYQLHELEYLVRQADLHTLCIIDRYKDSDYIDIVYKLVPELKTSQRGELKSSKFPELRNVIFIGQEKHRGMYNTQELLLLGQHVEHSKLKKAFNACDCHDVVNMQYTSGTTGFPKGVMLTHYNILNNGFSTGECQEFTENDNLCLAVPLFHCFGIVLGVMAILTHGSTMTIIEKFDPLVVLASIQKERCTALYGVPTMFIAELNHPMFNLFDLSNLRTGIMAGSSCPMETMKQVIAKMHMSEITIAYGLTEASPVMTQTSTNDPVEKRVSTIGKELPGIEVKILNPKTGSECVPEEQGELCCRGYNVMKGYYKNQKETEACIDSNGWLHSGDLGIKDQDGYFRVTGRIKDMIIRGGENIYPREIEEFLYTMPQIKEVQVAGVPDQKYGEQVGAFIILHEKKDIKSGDVKDFCRGKIARHKIPRYVFFVDNYPLTASGKIQKYKLGKIALELIKKGQT